MATKRVKLQGYGYWAKVFPENRDMKGFEGAYESHDGACTIDLDIDEDNLQKLQSSGSSKEGRESPDNEGYQRIKFIRKWEAPFEGLGGAPVVLKEDGSKWDLDEDGPIGNGSLVEVVISVYDLSKSKRKGTRLDKVKVLEHKQYIPDDSKDDEDEKEPSKKVTKSESPKGKPTTEDRISSSVKVKPKVTKRDDIEDDEIPF